METINENELDDYSLKQNLINSILFNRPRKVKKFSEEWSEDIELFGYNQVPYLLLIHPELTQQEKLLLILLRSYGEIYYGLSKSLAKNLGVTTKTIQLNFQNLERKCWIKRSFVNLEESDSKKRIRVIDTRPVKDKLTAFRNSEELLRYLTKRKHLLAKK